MNDQDIQERIRLRASVYFALKPGDRLEWIRNGRFMQGYVTKIHHPYPLHARSNGRIYAVYCFELHVEKV